MSSTVPSRRAETLVYVGLSIPPVSADRMQTTATTKAKLVQMEEECRTKARHLVNTEAGPDPFSLGMAAGEVKAYLEMADRLESEANKLK